MLPEICLQSITMIWKISLTWLYGNKFHTYELTLFIKATVVYICSNDSDCEYVQKKPRKSKY